MMKKLRALPLFQSKGFRVFLLAFFPVYICFATEFGQSQNLGTLWQFTLEKLGVALFGILLTTALFWVGALLTRRAWIGGLMVAALYMVCSCVEFYKNKSSGSHFLATDLKMLSDISGLGKFAKLYFSPVLFFCCLSAAALVFLLACCDIRFSRHFGFRWILPSAIAWMTALVVCVPSVFMPVCQAFGVDSTRSYNTFSDAERFSNNNLISNLVVSINQAVDSAVEKPQGYSPDAIEKLLDDASGPNDSEQALPAWSSQKPNVIVIMSETFADFRALDKDPALNKIYAPLDEILRSENIWSGKTVVPTFGGGTVKTEFELMFGLPVKSLNDAFIPHELLADGSEEIRSTLPSAYRQQGYATSYIHPYYANFYGRQDTYDRYGFDRLLFLDDLTVPQNTYHNGYVDDDTVYRQAESIMKETGGPDYIHITSMQNHMPYSSEDGLDEYHYYLQGIEKSCQALSDFLSRLAASGEPTIVLFTGDHFPYFNEQGNIYQKAGITSENCSVLYDQSCFIWSSAPLNKETLPTEKISAFYLPHLVYQATGLPENAVTDAVLSAMEQDPVYSIAEEMEGNDRLLDMLTYDRVLGEGYSNDEATVRHFVKPSAQNRLSK